MAKIPEIALPWPAPWPDAPRYGPPLPWPAYAFRPGAPHPRRHASGHAYGLPEPQPQVLMPEEWANCTLYLHSVDLYHAGYFWEAHEGWEALWKGSAPDSAPFLQALIQNSAAQLKWHTGNDRGAARLSRSAWRRLQPFVEHRNVFLGLHPAALSEALLHCYGPLWQGETTTCGIAPRLPLTLPEGLGAA